MSADQDHSEAQYTLGMIYLHGNVVPRDINKAIKYLTKSADQNNPLAQYELGKIMEENTYIEI